jgi:hypothetical protein
MAANSETFSERKNLTLSEITLRSEVIIIVTAGQPRVWNQIQVTAEIIILPHVLAYK